MQPIIIFCAFTRKWALDQWLQNLDSLNYDKSLISLATIIDIDDPSILRALRKFAEDKGYRKFVYKINTDWHPNEVRIKVRRLRIADIKNQSKFLINQCDGDIVISLEDDTVFPNMDIMRLIQPLYDDNRLGFVQGVQCGRHDCKMIGAWQADDPEDPQIIETLFPSEDYQDITAGGWYGYATRRDLYLNCDYFYSSSQPYGPDVNFGLWLQRKGYKCLIDWSMRFGHNEHNKIIYPDDNLVSVKYTKDLSTGLWGRQDTHQ